MLVILENGGIRVEVTSSNDVARLKSLGYVEVKPIPEASVESVPAVEVKIEQTPEQQNEEAIAAVNKTPAKSRKGKK